MNETRTQIIKDFTEIFEDEAKFPKNIAKQAAEDMIDKGWTYERTYRKYKKQIDKEKTPETA